MSAEIGVSSLLGCCFQLSCMPGRGRTIQLQTTALSTNVWQPVRMVKLVLPVNHQRSDEAQQPA